MNINQSNNIEFYKNELNLADKIHCDECKAFQGRIKQLEALVNQQNKYILTQEKMIKGLTSER